MAFDDKSLAATGGAVCTTIQGILKTRRIFSLEFTLRVASSRKVIAVERNTASDPMRD